MSLCLRIILFICLSFLFSFAAIAAETKIKIVTTIGQITDAVQNIGGERVEVLGLMGAGVDPHLYKASESDVRKLSQAQIIFYNGLHLEAKMGDILQKMSRNKRVVAVSDKIEEKLLLSSETYKNHHDPHIWFDVRLWIKVAERVRDELVDYDPTHKDQYHQRAQEYLQELEKLHTYVSDKANILSKEQRILVTAHDAFRYFGRTYDFEVIGLQGISTESEAGAGDVSRLAELIVSRKVKAVFIESSVPERNIKAVQEAVRSKGWDVKIGGELFSDAMGHHGTFEGTYIGMVTHNISTVVEALK